MVIVEVSSVVYGLGFRQESLENGGGGFINGGEGYGMVVDIVKEGNGFFQRMVFVFGSCYGCRNVSVRSMGVWEFCKVEDSNCDGFL